MLQYNRFLKRVVDFLSDPIPLVDLTVVAVVIIVQIVFYIVNGFTPDGDIDDHQDGANDNTEDDTNDGSPHRRLPIIPRFLYPVLIGGVRRRH